MTLHWRARGKPVAARTGFGALPIISSHGTAPWRDAPATAETRTTSHRHDGRRRWLAAQLPHHLPGARSANATTRYAQNSSPILASTASEQAIYLRVNAKMSGARSSLSPSFLLLTSGPAPLADPIPAVLSVFAMNQISAARDCCRKIGMSRKRRATSAAPAVLLVARFQRRT